LIRRADGYYVQFCISIEVKEDVKPSGKAIGLDVGLRFFYADNNGNTEENPRFYRQGEQRLNKLNRRKSRKFVKGQKTQSKNYHKARNRYARLHLRISRKREEHAKKLARTVCASNDCICYEDLQVKNLVRNHHLSKSINDAGWYQFRKWIEYFGWKFGKITVAVPPHFTSQDCPVCGKRTKKSLSNRTHNCSCGYKEDRDIAASINILKKGLDTTGHVGIRLLDSQNA
jgi:putative transposase